MKTPLTPIALYAILLTLKKPMDEFKKHNSASLTVEEVEIMKDAYDSVNVLSHGQLAQRLNVGCDNCIREAFQVFISVFDRMHKDPTINPEAEPVEGATVSKIDGVDYGDQLPPKGNGLKGAANANVNQIDLEEQANQLNTQFGVRRLALEELGFIFNEEGNVFTKDGETDLPGETVKQATEEDFNDGLAVMKAAFEEEPEPEAPKPGDILVPPAVFEPETKKEELTPGVALNTEATKTPAQKSAETKAANKAKAALKGAANEAK